MDVRGFRYRREGINSMQIKHIIQSLEEKGKWVNWKMTRDHVLFGDETMDVDKIGVCWIADMHAIQEAINQDIHFIITHENPFYLDSTKPLTRILEATKKKQDLLKKYNICIYRCHDVWDYFPKYGVADTWAEILELPFEERVNVKQPFHFANIDMGAKELAKYIAERIKKYGENGVTIVGNPEQRVTRLGIGVGACTSVYDMLDNGADCCLVSDDGFRSWAEAQYMLDMGYPMLIVSHGISEIPGLMNLVEYLKKSYKNVVYLNDKYTYTSIVAE